MHLHLKAFYCILLFLLSIIVNKNDVFLDIPPGILQGTRDVSIRHSPIIGWQIIGA